MGIRIFVGEDRVKAEKEIRRILGEDFEVIEGENLVVGDLPGIFRGISMFDSGKRRILVKNLGENAEVWGRLGEYLRTENEVIVWEVKMDKRLKGTKMLEEAAKNGVIEIREFKLPVVKTPFNTLSLAMRNGAAAVKEVEKIEEDVDPMMFIGALSSQAIKMFEQSGGRARERRILKELAELDLNVKSLRMDPWVMIKSFLLTVGEK